MTDIIDRAQEREAEILHDAHVQRCIDLANARALDAPLTDADGNRICIDCGERIPAGRLKYVPHAVRCCSCQVDEEYMHSHGGR